MNDETPMVQGEPNSAPVVEKPTTPAEGGVAQTTPAQAPVDAEALKKQLAEQQARFERDLNRTKSTLQSREAQARKEAEQKQEQLRRELEDIRRASMDEETRKKYDFEMAQSRINELQEELQRRDEEFTTFRATQNAIAHFRSLGVPESALILDGTFDDLLESGWGWVSDFVKEKNSAPAASAPPTPPILPVPPKVDTGGATSPSVKPTWADLEKVHGSREKVYELIELKRLPGSILPD